jgi:hypothetical protein
MFGVAFCVTATVAFAFGVTRHPCMETFTIFFLTLGFFTIAHLLLRPVFTSVFSYHSNTLNLFVVFVSVGASTATTLL